MSLLFQSLGTIYNTGSAVVQAVIPQAIINGTVAVASAAKNKIFSAVSIAVNTAKSAGTTLGNRVADLKDAAIASAVQDDPELFYRIDTVKNRIVNDLKAKQHINQVNRNELAETLEEFIELHQLEKEDKDFILSVCKDLRNVNILFDEAKLDQMDRVEEILHPYFLENIEYILSKVDERKRLEKLPGLQTSPSPKLTPKETLDGIQSQVDLLKSNSIKYILGTIALNLTLGLSTFEGVNFDALGIDCIALGITPPNGKNTNLINFLIEVSNKAHVEGQSSEEVFQDLMYRVIDNSERDILDRLNAKARCALIFDLVLNLVGNLFDNLKETVVHFANLPPTEQLEQLTKLLIDPLNKHLDDQQTQGASAKTADELLDEFIEAFLDQFLDKKYQPWTRAARAICNEKASQSDSVTKAFYTASSFALWCVGKCTAPIHWVVNGAIHGILKTVIVGLCPSLSNATKKSLEIGTDTAWSGLKGSLLQMLRQTRLNGLLPRTEDPEYQLPKELPAELKEKLTTTLDMFFKILATPTAVVPNDTDNPTLSSVTLDTLFKILATPDAKPTNKTPLLQKNLHGHVNSLKNTIKNSVAGLLLNLLAQDNFINGTLFSSLTSINASGFASTVTPPVSKEEKQKISADLQKELGVLGGKILRSVNHATRSDKSSQTKANTYITTLKQQVHAFNLNLMRCQQNKDISFKKSFLKACEEFNAFIEEFEEEITQTVDASTQELLMLHLNTARDHVLYMTEKLENCPVEAQRLEVEARLNELYPLLANQEDIDGVIEELRALNAPFLDINGLVNDLNEYRQIYLNRLRSTGQPPSIQPFLSIVADYKDRANTEAKAQSKLAKINSAIELSAELFVWANQLPFIKVTTKPTVKDAGMSAVYHSPDIKAITGSVLQEYGKNLFAFIGDEKNTSGIAQRIIEAYLNKPPMMPKKERQEMGYYAPEPESTDASPVRILSQAEKEKLTDRDWVVL